MRVSQHGNDQVGADRAMRVADLVTDPFGSWIYRLDDGMLSWTDSVFGLFGFAVNEVVPTLSLRAVTSIRRTRRHGTGSCRRS